MSINKANEYFANGFYKEALKSYLEVSLLYPHLSSIIRYNIELCCKKIIKNGEDHEFYSHPRFYRYGHGHSLLNGAVDFSGHCKLAQKRNLINFEKNKIKDDKLKIVFVADSNTALNSNRKIWGAETSAGFVISYGRSIGVDVIQADPVEFDKDAILNADLLVLRSIDRFDDEKQRFLRDVLFEKLKPYITYQHDYAFCRHRNSIKCNGVLDIKSCSDCLSPSSKYNLSQISYFSNLLDKSLLNIFISHPQRHIFGEAIGAAIDPSLVILPPIDPEVFKNKNTPRDPRLIVNTSGKLNSPNKGFDNVVAYIDKHPDYNYELYTESNADIVQFASARGNVKIMPPVDNENMPYIYSRAGSLLVMPSIMEPAGRTPIEAALCDCNVIMNDKLGVKYFNLPLNDSIKLRYLIYKSMDYLWSKIIKIAAK